MSTSSQPPLVPPLTVLIVGAGIGGLSAAIALRRAGHNIEIFEQSSFANELGAAIHLGPNASRVLRGYGYNEARLRGVRCESLEMMAPDGSTMLKANIDDVDAAYGSPWYMCHRVDIHNELKHLAFSSEGAGTPAKLHLSSRVASIDSQKGEITLVSGEVFKGDLIIGADGIHSIVREHVLGGDFSPPPTGHSAFRFLISVSRLAADPVVAKYVPSPDKPGMTIILDSEKRMVLYPCRDATILNVAAIHPDHLSQHSSTEEWNANTRTAEDLKRAYANFAPEYHRLFELADEIKLWQLKDRGPLDTWIKGRACLLGDACHPMLPHQGQGGGQAIEDGAALGVVFGPGIPAADVPSRLKYYEFIRKNRADTIQEFSRSMVIGKKIPADPSAVQKFTFAHDVVAYAKGALSAMFIPSMPQGELPAWSYGPLEKDVGGSSL